jgi:hypothetical protein
LRKPVSACEYSPEFIARIADSKICLAVSGLMQNPELETSRTIASVDLRTFMKSPYTSDHAGEFTWISFSL